MDLLQTPLSMEASSELIAPVFLSEIKNTMFAIGGEKAFGSDGFTSQFFKIAWSIVGDDVVAIILHFFHTNELLLAFNSIIVSLVPKC